MFNQNNDEEKKLDWMYKGPNSNVSREEYLLGRPVDKTLDQLNDEEKQKQQQSLIPVSKNRVEHECIPPSIRDFNKVVQSEQVDLSTKLQEDPLVAIKKREEESRRQFLQNPVQLKKLQKALKAQQAKKIKKKKKSKSSDSEGDLESKLTQKLLGKKSKKIGKDERQLDTILIHKLEALKDKLTESDLQDIFDGKFTDSDDSSDEKSKKKSLKEHRDSSEDSEEDRKHKKFKNLTRREDTRRREPQRRDSSSDSRRAQNQDKSRNKTYNKPSYREDKRKQQRPRKRIPCPEDSSSSENEPGVRNKHSKKYDSDDSDAPKNKKVNYGLVSSDGKKIALSKKRDHDSENVKETKTPEPTKTVQERRAHKLTEEEKEKLRLEMMDNAVWRDKERIHNVKKYREKDEKEKKEQNFDPEFIHKQLVKSADQINSVESRIKANLNNIQRSSRDMDRHFSRR